MRDEARRSDLVDLAGQLEHETALAYLFSDGTQKAWLPKSIVEYDQDSGTFTMPEYLAKEKGLI